MLDEILVEVTSKLKSSYDVFVSDLSGIRSGIATVSMLDGVVVNSNLGKMRINQIASLSVVNNKMLSVQVWDKSNVGPTKDAIISSDLGLNPIVEGMVLRLPVPELNEERRKELVKVLRKYADRAKVAVRNIRRDAIARIKSLEKDKQISEDEMHSWTKKIEKVVVDEDVKVDKVVEKKQAEILSV